MKTYHMLLKQLAAVIVLAVAISPNASAVCRANGAELFPALVDYEPYEDLRGGEWYFEAAKVCRQTGLYSIDGAEFSADTVMTFGECNDIAFRLRNGLYGAREADSQPDYPLNPTYSPDDLINRESFADMLTTVIREEELPIINNIQRIPGSIYDNYDFLGGYVNVAIDDKDIGGRVLRLYKSGILIGNEFGYFSPFRPLTRAEAVAIVYRIIRPDDRLKFDAGSFITDSAITNTKINLDKKIIDYLSAENSHLNYTGDAFIAIHSSSETNRKTCAVVSMDGAMATPVFESYEQYAGNLFVDISDNMARYIDNDGVHHFYAGDGSNGGVEITTDSPILESTLYNDEYAAVRFEDADNATVHVIDKQGRSVNSIASSLPFKLVSIHPNDGVILGWADEIKTDRYDYYRPWDENANVIVNINSGNIINLEDQAWISDFGFRSGYILAEKRLANAESNLIRTGDELYDFIDANGSWLGFDKKNYDFPSDVNDNYFVARYGVEYGALVDYSLNEIDLDYKPVQSIELIEPYNSIVSFVTPYISENGSGGHQIIKDVDENKILSIRILADMSVVYENLLHLDGNKTRGVYTIADVFGNALFELPKSSNIQHYYYDTKNSYSRNKTSGFVYECDGEYYHFRYLKPLDNPD